MAREDILGGLRNALERGESLENAKQSMINAGYSVNDVEEAVFVLAGKTEQRVVSPSINETIKANEIKDVIDIESLRKKEFEGIPAPPVPSKKHGFFRYVLIMFIILIVLILIAVIAYFLGESLDIKFIQNIFQPIVGSI